MNAPKTKTNAAATRWPAGIRSHRPTELAAKPNSSVKTMVNPRANRSIGTTSRRRSVERPPDTNAR
jgi:hypothetical protein